MKKFTITLMLSIVILLISQQMHAQLSYKPLRDFNGDSIAYFRYNFQNDYMDIAPERTMLFFFEKMEIPIKSFEIHIFKNRLISIMFYTESVEKINDIKATEGGEKTVPYAFFATFRSLTNYIPIEPFVNLIPNLESEKVLPWDDAYADAFRGLEVRTFNYQYIDPNMWNR